MSLPRSKYVQEGKEGVYHCFSRCVRRAFLYGFDPLTGRDFAHRKAWLVDRLRQLAAIFAIEVCAYAILANHYHTVLRTRPDIVATWSDQEVARRWLALFPLHRGLEGTAGPIEEQIRGLAQCPERIAILRRRLCSLSWFMGRLNEFIARAANKEDAVKGRFWESRFKCQALLDDAAIAACMVYVDLNPIRAGLADTPEESDYTSIQERIRAWRKETMPATSVPTNASQNSTSGYQRRCTPMPRNAGETSDHAPNHVFTPGDPFGNADLSPCWLCPISSESPWGGILQMTVTEYFDLVDKSGRMVRSDKRGVIDADITPILVRLGANPIAWSDTISHFGDRFHLVAGIISNLRNFANQLGQRYFKGAAMARAAFAPSPP